MSPTSIVAYLTLFAATGFLFLFAALALGWLLRARAATPEKLETYECGEPPVGSSFVQFDLRFYVVALVFIIFEVEVAFFFPWATVFGKATQMRGLAAVAAADGANTAAATQTALVTKYRELGASASTATMAAQGSSPADTQSTARALSLSAMLDMAAFFAVLLVGFAYVWGQGDLDWVRAAGRREAPAQAAATVVEGSVP